MYTCILLWSFRQSAWKQQIGAAVCLDLSYEDPFVPQTQNEVLSKIHFFFRYLYSTASFIYPLIH